MNVAQLIEFLKTQPQHLRVCFDAGGSCEGEPAIVESASIELFFGSVYWCDHIEEKQFSMVIQDGDCLWLKGSVWRPKRIPKWGETIVQGEVDATSKR